MLESVVTTFEVNKWLCGLYDEINSYILLILISFQILIFWYVKMFFPQVENKNHSRLITMKVDLIRRLIDCFLHFCDSHNTKMKGELTTPDGQKHE